jgi:hypothetical protein
MSFTIAQCLSNFFILCSTLLVAASYFQTSLITNTILAFFFLSMQRSAV